MKKPLVYIAHPMTLNWFVEARKAFTIASTLRDFVTPLLPDVCVLWYLVDPKEHQRWVDYDLEIISNCDALLRLPGESPGADAEVKFATEKKIRCFNEPSEVIRWSLTWNPYD